MKIKIHSIIDVITNSSTEVFIFTHNKSIEILKELIDSLLNIGDSGLKADDLFEFKITSENQDEYAMETFADNNGLSWDELENLIKNGFINNPELAELWKDFDILVYEDISFDEDINILPKQTDDPSIVQAADVITKNLKSIFKYEASYDG